MSSHNGPSANADARGLREISALRKVTDYVVPIAAVFLVAAIGASHVFDPFSGDQALFLLGASSLNDGGVLYRDFWDIKQPGIFLFFLAGGRIFGFTQMGEYIANLLWQMVFAVTLVVGFRSALSDKRWTSFAAIAVVGEYYMGSSPWHLIQVEGLVGLPLFCCSWMALAAAASDRGRCRLAAFSGLAAGIAVLFKFLFLIVALAIVVSVIATADINRLKRSKIVEFFLAWLAGLSVPLLLILLYGLHFGVLRELIDTNLRLPLEISATVPHAPVARLVDSASRFVIYFRGVILLAIIGALFVHDQRSRPWRLALWAWFGSAVFVILIQTQSWWQYHFLLLVPPVGLLATFGIVFLANCVARGGLWGWTALASCGIAAYVAVALPKEALATAARIEQQRPFASELELEQYRATLSTEYATAALDAGVLGRNASAGNPVYVFGDPLIYVLAHRKQAVAINGWALQLYTPAIWRQLNLELVTARPQLIFVLDGYKSGLLPERSPATESFLDQNFVVMHRTLDGAWYNAR